MSRSRHLIIHRSKTNMETNTSDPKQYTKQLLELYLHTPGTLGRIRREDRRLAISLHDRGVSLLTVEASFVLATARRCLRAPDAPALSSLFCAGNRGAAGESLAGRLPEISERKTQKNPASP
jgi:hypothetical protein